MADTADPILSPAARALLSDIARDGEARTKGRTKAAQELDRRGLVHLKKGTATLTRAGRWATREKAHG